MFATTRTVPGQTLAVAVGALHWRWDTPRTAGMHVELPGEGIEVLVSLVSFGEGGRARHSLAIAGSTGLRSFEMFVEVRTRRKDARGTDCALSLERIVRSAWFQTRALPEFMAGLYHAPRD